MVFKVSLFAYFLLTFYLLFIFIFAHFSARGQAKVKVEVEVEVKGRLDFLLTNASFLVYFWVFLFARLIWHVKLSCQC